MTASRVMGIVCVAVVLGVCLQGAVAETRVYKIGEYFPSPPWDVGPLEGVSFDILSAICEANDRPSPTPTIPGLS